MFDCFPPEVWSGYTQTVTYNYYYGQTLYTYGYDSTTCIGVTFQYSQNCYTQNGNEQICVYGPTCCNRAALNFGYAMIYVGPVLLMIVASIVIGYFWRKNRIFQQQIDAQMMDKNVTLMYEKAQKNKKTSENSTKIDDKNGEKGV